MNAKQFHAALRQHFEQTSRPLAVAICKPVW